MSSHFSEKLFLFLRSSNNLDAVPENLKLLTVKFPLETLAEFSAAAEFNSARTVSALVHQFVHRTIDDTKKKVEPAKFQEVYKRKRSEIEERSRRKSAERKRARKADKKAVVINKRSQKTG